MKVLVYCDYNINNNNNDDDDDDDYSNDNCDDDDRLCVWYRKIISSPCIT